MSKLNHLHKPSRKKSSKKDFKLGYRITTFAVLFLGILVIVQAFRWQIVKGQDYVLMASQQYSNSQAELPDRGMILAYDGTILAVDDPVWNVYASLSSDENEREAFFTKKGEWIAEVSTILGLTIDEVDSKITDDFRYVLLKKGISNEKKKALESLSIFRTPNLGLYYEKDVKRSYPNNNLAAHVLGFIGQNDTGEYIGQYGIEGYYASTISGQAGYLTGEKDSFGNIILNEEYDPLKARSGVTFQLTIRPNIQLKVEEILEKHVRSTESKSGSVIIMDPKTGEIIAMANYPTYNPNQYWLTQEPWIFRNMTISDVYEYGSIHKPLTVAIGLESGEVEPNYTCNDSTGVLDLFEVTGYSDVRDMKIYTWDKKAAGMQDISDMLKNSNNPCIARLALEIEPEYYYNKLKEFGIGSSINIGLQDESTSYMTPFSTWTKLDIITSSFGQSLSATPLQVLSALSAIANDGKRMQPYLVDATIDNEIIQKTKPQVISQPISQDVANQVALMMQKVATDGIPVHEAQRTSMYNISSKTGTAQIARSDEAGYESGKVNASYIGFAPTENPKMIMIVKLSEPKIGRFSSSNAVPLWNEIFLEIANDLEIPRNN